MKTQEEAVSPGCRQPAESSERERNTSCPEDSRRGTAPLTLDSSPIGFTADSPTGLRSVCAGWLRQPWEAKTPLLERLCRFQAAHDSFRNSLAVQLLGLSTFTSRSPGPSLVGELRSRKLHSVAKGRKTQATLPQVPHDNSCSEFRN